MSSRIAYVINQYPKVSHTFIRREILALERQGFEILRISLRGWDAELADEEDMRERKLTRYVLRGGGFALLWVMMRTMLTTPRRFFSALALAVRVGGLAGGRPLPFHLVYLAEACRILPWIKTFGATHVHAHFGTNSAEVVMLANAMGGPPYSFTAHGQDEFLSDGFREKVHRASFVVAISSFARSMYFRRIEHSHWRKVKEIHCGLENEFHMVNPQMGTTSIPRIVCVGRLSNEKGQLVLIEAARRLAVKGIKFELVLAGDGEMRKELESLISQYGLNCRITGWISSAQVRKEILAARALVLPSFSEGLPVVIMEAMALRRPVLATYVGGIPELVLPGENGWLFPAGSVDDLESALGECLLKSPVDLRKMGDACYLRVIERHSIDTEAAKLAELFLNSGEPI